MKRIIISRTDAIGDVILTLPMAGIIKQQLPGSHIIFFGKTYTEPVVKCAEHIDEFINYDDFSNLDKQGQSEFIRKTNADCIIHVFPRRSQMIIVGAAHITAELVQLAHQFDFETIVIDPRGTFAKNTTFVVKPDQIFEKYPSEVLNDFPLDPYTYAVILSHDPKIDDDALQICLRKKVAYIGALGSKKNHEKRCQRLLEKGFAANDVARIDAPIGLDIKAKGAKEIALSIMGAVIKAKNLYV